MDQLALRRVIDEVQPLSDRFAAAGHRVYLVGGIVRDLVLERHRSAPDIDLTTDATPDEVVAVIDGHVDALWKQGERFGTIGCRVGSRVFEITTHRAEAYLSASRKPIVSFSRRVDDDLSRRDFTVNAMALSLPDATLIDPFNGRGDLDAHVLRTPLAPEESFSDDPLRMLRAARFVAGYDLQPTPPTESAIARLRHRLTIVSRERIRDELDKLLSVVDPSAGLVLLRRTKLFDEFLPELGDHASAAVDPVVLVGRVDGLVQRRAALFADVADRAAVRARLRALRYPTDDVDTMTRVLVTVDAIASLDRVDPGAARRVAHLAGPALDDALALAAAMGVARADALGHAVDELRRRGDTAPFVPELDGDEVQRVLGITEGPDVGAAQRFLLGLRLDEGLVGAAEARRRLQAWWARRD